MDAERRTGTERRTDQTVSSRLDEIEAGYKKRSSENRALIEKFSRWVAIILTVLTIVQLALGVLSIRLVVQNGHQQDRGTRQQLAIAATVRAIQQQRAEATWDGCRTQNYHHDLTVQRLTTLVAAVKDPAQKSRAENNTAATVSLIDALSPVQDCKLLLAERLHVKGAALDRAVKRLTAEFGPARPPKR